MAEPIDVASVEIKTHHKLDGWITIFFRDAEKGETSIALPANMLGNLLKPLVETVASLRIDEAMERDVPKRPGRERLPATEAALLQARRVEVVRWTTGAAALRIGTDDGMEAQFLLSSALREDLLTGLSGSLPPP